MVHFLEVILIVFLSKCALQGVRGCMISGSKLFAKRFKTLEIQIQDDCPASILLLVCITVIVNKKLRNIRISFFVFLYCSVCAIRDLGMNRYGLQREVRAGIRAFVPPFLRAHDGKHGRGGVFSKYVQKMVGPLLFFVD